MAEDKDQKTEEPTDKKLREAEEKGELASSQEVKTWFLFLAVTLIMLFASNWFLASIGRRLGGFIGRVHEISAQESGLLAPVAGLVQEIALITALPLGLLMLAALAGNRLQNKGTFTLEKLKPDLSRLDPLKGMKRLVSLNSLVELGKAVFKICIVGAVVLAIVWPERDRLDSMVFVPMDEVVRLLQTLIIQLFVGVAILLTFLAAADYAWQNYQYRKNLRMTKQEVKDERKQADGDPQIKMRLRRIRMDRFSKRLQTIIPESDVVITNPTHFAVALRYRHGEMAVPVVTAKGVDSMALRIRALADEHSVPIVENPPLARALHASADIDAEIPYDHYKAVAAVIGYVMKLGPRRTRMQGQPGRL